MKNDKKCIDLVDLGLVYRAYNLREISSPLEAQKIATECKVYMADTGLLTAMLEQGTAAHILRGDLSAYKGAMAENMVAACFSSCGAPLYYYHAPSGSPELDFIYSDDGQATIIECKAGNNRATSMKYVLSHPEKYGVHPGIKVADANIGDSGSYLTYPLYALPFLLPREHEQLLTLGDVEELNAAVKEL